MRMRSQVNYKGNPKRIRSISVNRNKKSNFKKQVVEISESVDTFTSSSGESSSENKVPSLKKIEVDPKKVRTERRAHSFAAGTSLGVAHQSVMFDLLAKNKNDEN